MSIGAKYLTYEEADKKNNKNTDKQKNKKTTEKSKNKDFFFIEFNAEFIAELKPKYYTPD